MGTGRPPLYSHDRSRRQSNFRDGSSSTARVAAKVGTLTPPPDSIERRGRTSGARLRSEQVGRVSWVILLLRAPCARHSVLVPCRFADARVGVRVTRRSPRRLPARPPPRRLPPERPLPRRPSRRRPPPRVTRRRRSVSARRPTRRTSTRSSSRSTPTLVSRTRRCLSSTRSSTISSRGSVRFAFVRGLFLTTPN